MTKTNCELVRDKGSFPVLLLLLPHIERKKHMHMNQQNNMQYGEFSIAKKKLLKHCAKKNII